MKLLVGTKNPDKVKEIQQLLKDLPVQILTMADFPNLPEVEEPHPTIRENAITKAEAYANFSGMPTIADDTGFFIAALGGEPGVKAARYAGEKCSYQDNRIKALEKMQSKTNRIAYFETVVAYFDKDKNIHTFTGKIKGEIAMKESGEHGFGYDSIFFIPEFQKTFAEMKDEDKNKISHRGLALQKFVDFLKNEIDND
jgi:XTP/dITP diphosphohydrolase